MLIIKKKIIYIVGPITLILFLSITFFAHLMNLSENTFVDPGSGIIVIDPGHGGIDGGTNKDGILEKEVNLSIAKKLRTILEQKGHEVVMTREEDVSLDTLDHSNKSRHQKDLNARVNMINNNNAQLFISIHVNCNLKKPASDGAIVFYSDKYEQNKTLAYSIQRALNNMIVNGKKRTVRDPQPAKFFVLINSEIPGVIVETAFISNPKEKILLTKDEFRKQLAQAIAEGVEQYLKEKGTGIVFLQSELRKE